MCFIYDELPIMHVDMSDKNFNLDDQMQKAVAAKLFLLLNGSQYYIPKKDLLVANNAKTSLR